MLKNKSITKKLMIIALSALMLAHTFTSGVQFALASEDDAAAYKEATYVYPETEEIPEYEYIETEPEIIYVEEDETEVIPSFDYDEIDENEALEDAIEIVPLVRQVRLDQIFECRQLARVVADELSGRLWRDVRLDDPIELTWLLGVRALSSHHNRIESLVGLEYLTFLNRVVFPHNQIDDATPLLELAHLYYIDLSHNQISDITQLQTLRANIVDGIPGWSMIYHNNPAVGGGIRRMFPRMVFHGETNVFVNSWNTSLEPIWAIPAGTTLIPEDTHCTSTDQCHVNIRLGDRVGWATNIVNENVETIVGRGTMRTTDNIRRGPGAGYSKAVFYNFAANQDVLILGQIGDWFAIHSTTWPKFGREGNFDATFWIHRNNLTITESANWNSTVPPTVVDTTSIEAMTNFLTENTASNQVVIPANVTTEAEILSAVTAILNDTYGLNDAVTVTLLRQDNTEFTANQINNITIELRVNPTYVFENQTIYFRQAVEVDTENVAPGGGGNDNNQNNVGNDGNENDNQLLPQTGIHSLNVVAFGVISAKIGLVTAIIKNKKK